MKYAEAKFHIKIDEKKKKILNSLYFVPITKQGLDFCVAFSFYITYLIILLLFIDTKINK